LSVLLTSYVRLQIDLAKANLAMNFYYTLSRCIYC